MTMSNKPRTQPMNQTIQILNLRIIIVFISLTAVIFAWSIKPPIGTVTVLLLLTVFLITQINWRYLIETSVILPILLAFTIATSVVVLLMMSFGLFSLLTMPVDVLEYPEYQENIKDVTVSLKEYADDHESRWPVHYYSATAQNGSNRLLSNPAPPFNDGCRSIMCVWAGSSEYSGNFAYIPKLEYTQHNTVVASGYDLLFFGARPRKHPADRKEQTALKHVVYAVNSMGHPNHYQLPELDERRKESEPAENNKTR